MCLSSHTVEGRDASTKKRGCQLPTARGGECVYARYTDSLRWWLQWPLRWTQVIPVGGDLTRQLPAERRWHVLGDRRVEKRPYWELHT